MQPIVTIRASSIGDWLDCPARAEAKHLLHLRTPTTAGATIGKAIHRATAVYDQSVIDGAGVTADEAAGAAVDTIHKPDEETIWDDDESQKEAETIAVALHKLYCTKVAPTQSYAAVEVLCERLEISDLGIALTGTTDRVRNTEEGYAISDLKSGKRAVSADGVVETKGAAFQLGIYEILAERGSELPITGPAQVVGLQTGKTEKGQRAAVSAPVVGARDVLIGEPDSPGVLEIVAAMIHSGNFLGNPRSMLCHPRYCPIYNRCKFRK